MRIVTRYLTAELLKVFFVTLAGLTLLILLFGLGQEAVRRGLGAGPVLRLIPFILPQVLCFSVPGTMLFTACSVYGRLAANNEVMAVKSLGISPLALVWPAIVVSFVLSLIAVWLNDAANSWGRNGMHGVILHSVEEVAYGMLRTQRSFSTNRFSINVRRVEGRVLVRPTIVFHANGNSPTVTLIAERAELRSNLEDSTLSIFLTNGTVQVGNQAVLAFSNTEERVIPLAEGLHKGGLAGGPSNLPIRAYHAAIVRQEQKIRHREEALAARAAYDMLAGDFAALTGEEWSRWTNDLAEERATLHRLRAEPWRRWANGFSCLSFALIAAPLAMRRRNADLMSTLLTVFLPVLIVYYAFFMLGVNHARKGDLPPYAIWLANGVCAGVGLWLLRREVQT